MTKKGYNKKNYQEEQISQTPIGIKFGMEENISSFISQLTEADKTRFKSEVEELNQLSQNEKLKIIQKRERDRVKKEKLKEESRDFYHERERNRASNEKPEESSDFYHKELGRFKHIQEDQATMKAALEEFKKANDQHKKLVKKKTPILFKNARKKAEAKKDNAKTALIFWQQKIEDNQKKEANVAKNYLDFISKKASSQAELAKTFWTTKEELLKNSGENSHLKIAINLKLTELLKDATFKEAYSKLKSTEKDVPSKADTDTGRKSILGTRVSKSIKRSNSRVNS